MIWHISIHGMESQTPMIFDIWDSTATKKPYSSSIFNKNTRRSDHYGKPFISIAIHYIRYWRLSLGEKKTFVSQPYLKACIDFFYWPPQSKTNIDRFYRLLIFLKKRGCKEFWSKDIKNHGTRISKPQVRDQTPWQS